MSEPAATAAPPPPHTNAPAGMPVWLRAVLTVLVCLTILGAAAAAVVVINRTEPTAKKVDAVRKSAALVETVLAKEGTYSPRLAVLGTVRPAEEVMLSPRVSGQVVEVAEGFLPGGMVRAGEWLLRIDPADFENATAAARSRLRQAEAALRLEEGRQTLAKKELSLLEGSIKDANRSLVLREPQLESARAEVQSAQASVDRAALDLSRTEVVAPFDAQVLSRDVNVGSQVSPGDELARLVGVRQYWVLASVPVKNLSWIEFPETDGRGSVVVLRNPDGWPDGERRYARVSRLIGALDQQTRLARVLLTVDDPLALTSDAPPLILDSIVQVEIAGRPIEGVVRLPRDLVHDGDTVWVMKDEKLEIREADIVFRDADHAYIRGGVGDGEEVVTTTLATVAEGIGLRREGEPAQPDEDDASGATE